jgi:O-antigen ligase
MIARAWLIAPGWSSTVAAAAAALALGLLLGALASLASPLAALAALLGAAFALAVLRRPLVGLYALVGLIFLLPFANVPGRLGFQLTALEAVLGLTLAATLARALVHRERPRPTPLTRLLAAFMALAALAFLLSLPHMGPPAEVGRRVEKLVLAMLVLPLSLRLVSRDETLRGLTRALVLCATLEALLAIGLYFAPRETTVRILSALGPLGYPTGPAVLRFLPGENDTYTDVLRATGSSIDPNVLGGALMIAAAVALAQLFSPRPALPRLLLLPAGGLLVWAMLLSHSRGSWVGLAAGLLALATLRERRLWLAAIPAAAAVALLPAGRALYNRVLSGFAGQDKAANMRLDEYRNALEIVQQHPLIGIGFGGPPTIDLAPGVSSIYLTVAQTSGLPALALYLAALGLLLGRALRALLGSVEPDRQASLAGLFAALVAALVAGLFDHYWASTAFPHMVALFWLCCGLLWRAAEPSPTTQHGDPSRERERVVPGPEWTSAGEPLAHARGSDVLGRPS